MNRIYLLLIVVIFITSFSDDTDKGTNLNYIIKIIDNVEKKPVAYANIFFFEEKSGFVCNQVGVITLVNETEILKGMLQISCVGYKTKVLNLINLKLIPNDTNIIEIERKIYELNEITIKAGKAKKSKSFKIGYVSSKKARFGSIYRSYGSQSARFFPNIWKNKESYITSVSYFVKNGGYPKSKFRIRIYNVDAQGKPGDDILTENLITNAEKVDEWTTIDISNYFIKVPEKGFFVAMEWLPISKDSVYFVKSVSYDGKKSYNNSYNGQILGAVSNKIDSQDYTWYKNLEDNTWYQKEIDKSIQFHNIINASIAAKITVYQ